MMFENQSSLIVVGYHVPQQVTLLNQQHTMMTVTSLEGRYEKVNYGEL